MRCYADNAVSQASHIAKLGDENHVRWILADRSHYSTRHRVGTLKGCLLRKKE